MADVKIVKSLYTGADVTSLGEVATADNARLPGALQVDGATTLGSLAGFLFGTAGVVSAISAGINKNAIINGAMDIWQRGSATLTNPASSTYFPDRFLCAHNLGDGTYNLLQGSETPIAGFPFQYSFKLDCTAVETAVAAGEYCFFEYKVEGFDFKRFEGEVATLSFWVKAVKTGVYCVSFRNDAINKSYVHEFTVSSASTWERKTVTLTFNSGGTFLYTNGTGLHIGWSVVCGSTYQIATANKDTWQAGNYLATDAQVNGLDNASNNFWLTGVQLELGSVATPFEFRAFAEELALCQRYFWKSFSYATAPVVTSGSLDGVIGYVALVGGAVYASALVYLPVKLRATVSPVFYNPISSNSKWYNITITEDSGTSIGSHPGNGSFIAINYPQVIGDLVSNTIGVHATMDAEL